MRSKQPQTQPKTAPQKQPPGAALLSRYHALEQRILLDAAAAETAEQVLASGALFTATAEAAHPGGDLAAALLDVGLPLPAVGRAPEILFVDTSVANYQALLPDLGAQVEVHLLEGADWAQQVQDVLAARKGDVSAIHVVSHGGAGRLVLGGETVDGASLDNYAAVWSAMRQALVADGDLLIYGCDVAAGAEGAAFINALAERTGADVAASADLSGAAALGGDWYLEANTGVIAASTLFTSDSSVLGFNGVLADGWVQDGTEVSAGTATVNASAAMTQTSDGREWKFVGRAGAQAATAPATGNVVYIYERNSSTGVWTQFGTLTNGSTTTWTGNGTGGFGSDLAAAGNKLSVSAPTFDGGGDNGRVYVFTWNGTNWTTGGQVVEFINPTVTGSIRDIDNGSDNFGYTVDMASDGAGNYKLIIGNPNQDFDSGIFTADRSNVGIAYVLSATSHGAFDETPASVVQLSSMWNGEANSAASAGNLFGASVAIGYDRGNGAWWAAVGLDGLDQVAMYKNPVDSWKTAANTYGQQQLLSWSSSGVNDFSMHDDYLAIGNATTVDVYNLNAASTAWSLSTAINLGGNAVVFMADMGVETAANTLLANKGVVVLSFNSAEFGAGALGDRTFVGRQAADGSWAYEYVNSRLDLSTALDRWRARDVVGANLAGSGSWHYNQDPTATNDSASVTEDASVAVNVLSNDVDFDITAGYPFGDVLAITGIGTSAYGATVSYSGGNVTYNASSSAYLNTLAVGQSMQDVISVTITDGQGGTSKGLLTVTISGVNDIPTTTALNPLTPYTLQQSDSTVAYDFSAYFTDVDEGEAAMLVPEATVLPPGWSAVTSGLLLLVTAPASAADGSDNTITVRVKDAQGAYSATTKSFIIRIDAVNNAPIVQNPIPDQTTLALYSFSYVMPVTTFYDSDPAPFDTITYTATLSSGAPLPAWLTFDPQYRAFSGVPGAGDVAVLTVRVTASDGVASTFDDFTLTVVNPTLKTLTQFADGAAAQDNLGFSTAISEDGNWLVAGAPGGTSTSPGSVSVYWWNGTGWTPVTFTSPVTAGARFGWSVDVSTDGTKMVIGASGENSGMGAVYCYTRSGTGASSTFALSGKFTASGATANDRFGTSVAINEAGTFVLIGANQFDYAGLTDSGAAFMAAFPSGGGTVVLAANVLPKDPNEFDYFGNSVAFDQNILVVSATKDDNPAGMVTRLAFDDVSGTYAAPSFGAVGGTLSASAQFAQDAVRGAVLQLAGTDGKVTLNSPVDIGASWAISSWYNGVISNGGYRTLTRGADYSEVQQLLVTSTNADDTGTFTITLPGVATTAAITWHTTDATLASRIQTALNNALTATYGANQVTVAVTGVDTYSVTFNTTGTRAQMTATALAGGTSTVTTLADGSTGDHQIIIDTGSNRLGVWNNSGVGAPGFYAADGVEEVQRLVLTSGAANDSGTFTLTVGGTTTAAITWHTTDATLATRMQTALNNALGANSVTVTVTAADTYSITFKAPGEKPQLTHAVVSGTQTATISTLTQGGGYQLTAAQLTGWHNIVAVGEGSSTTFYIDGVKVGTAAYKPTDDVLAVGNYQGNGQRFADYLDDFRIYDRALSASEIRNVYTGVAAASAPYADAGSLYVFSTDLSNTQVAKLYVPDALNNDMLGWAIDVDIFDVGGVRQSGLIVASSIYNDAKATDAGAVYVWRSTSLQSGTLNNGGLGNGTWILENKLTSFDSTAQDYYGSDIALDYDEATGGTRLLVGAQFEDTNGAYSGAVYAYKYAGSGNWLPEKFVNALPQGGSVSTAGFFGNAVAVADTRAVIGSRWRDTSGQTNDGALYWADLLTQGNYSTVLSAETAASESYFLSASEMDVVALDTSGTQGTVSYAADGQMVYTPSASFKSLGLGQSVIDSFTYLTEQNGTTYINTVNVTVYGVDDGVDVGADIAEVSASAMTLINVLANDIDPDADASTLVIQSLATSTVQGRVYNTGSALIYDPQGKFDTLRAGEAVQEVFTYTVIDSSGNEVTGYVTLLVVGAEDPVVAVSDNVSVKANAAVTIDVLANDVDKDGQDTFWLASIDDSAALGSVVRNADGTITYLPGAAFKYLKAGETATDRIVYTVRDDAGNESSALLTVLVIGVNDAPTASNDAVTVVGGSTITIDALANDVDPDGDAIRITRVITNATLGQVVLNADGTISYSAPADAVADSFSYEIIDSLGQTSIATVYVSAPGVVPEVPPGVPETPGVAEVPGVSGVSAPGVSIVPGVAQADVAVTSGTSPVSIAVAGNDDRGGVLTAVSTAGANGTVAVVDGNVLVYTPGESLATWPAGRVFVDRFTYTVQYANGSVSTAYVHVYVNGTYVAPVVDDEEEDRFALPEASLGVSGGLALAPVPAGVSGADAAAVLNNDVARMALDGLLEMATVPDEPPAAPPAGVDVEEPAAVPAVSAPTALMQETIKPEMAKPGLSAALGREVQSRRAGADALLRHFADKNRTGSGRVSA